jgi:PRC-barrel domain
MEVEMDLKHVEGNWKKAVALASAVMVGVLLLSGGAEAQVTPQTIELAKIDVQKLSAGYRASKVIGSSVVNDANEFIGKVDDLLVSVDGKEPYAVLSVGGFLGMGTHLVVVPYDTLKFAEKQVMLPGGTKEGLRLLPEFKYATQ